MSVTATVYMQCDNCGEDESVDLAGPGTLGSTGPENIEERARDRGLGVGLHAKGCLLCPECSATAASSAS